MTKDDLTHFAEQKKRAQLVRYNRVSERHDLTREDARFCAGIMADVTADKGEDGKPLYSNEQARKAEAQRREEASDDLAKLRAKARKLDAEIAEIDADITYLTDMIRIGCAFAAVPELA